MCWDNVSKTIYKDNTRDIRKMDEKINNLLKHAQRSNKKAHLRRI